MADTLGRTADTDVAIATDPVACTPSPPLDGRNYWRARALRAEVRVLALEARIAELTAPQAGTDPPSSPAPAPAPSVADAAPHR